MNDTQNLPNQKIAITLSRKQWDALATLCAEALQYPAETEVRAVGQMGQNLRDAADAINAELGYDPPQ